MAALYDITGVPIGAKYTALKSAAEKLAQQEIAELLLNLTAPVYTNANEVVGLTLAIAHQIDFQLEQGLTSEEMKSVGNSHSGLNTTYRDRWVSPVAWDIVKRITKVATVGFTALGPGV